MSSNNDAVFVGSGVNALVCAAHLASLGWRVTVLEQSSRPGGAVKSGEYTLPGFTHDWAAMNLSLFAGSAFHARHGAELAQHGLQFVPVKHPFASAFPDGSWLGVSHDRKLTTARIRAHDAVDGQTWDQLSAEFPQRFDRIGAVLGTPMQRGPVLRTAWKLWRAEGTAGLLDLTRFLVLSPRAWLEECFRSPKVRALLSAWGMHLDFAPDAAGGAMFPYLEGMAGQSFGMALVSGGAQGVTDALCKMIESHGGTIRCNASVSQILHEGGRASAVRLADDEVIQARKAVVAGVAPKTLAQLTGDTGSGRFDKGLATYSHAPGTLMIHVAASALPPWRARELRRFAYVHLAPSLDQMAATYTEARAGLLPKEPVIVCGQPTVADPSRAPEGQHSLWLQVRMAPGRIRGDAAGRIDARDWADAAAPFAERVFDLIETYAPGFRHTILHHRIVPPSELEGDNPNLVGGDQICGSHHLSQHFMYRPLRGHADGRTPIRNLHLTGAAVWPGAGTGAGAGWMLANKLAGS